jgi:hypothetical protein
MTNTTNIPANILELRSEYLRLRDEWLRGACSLRRLEMIEERLRRVTAAWRATR